MSTRSPKSGARARRKPHNARSVHYASFEELLAQIAAEPRTARVGDEQVTMSRSDRLLRLLVDRALQGDVRNVTKLLQLMAKYPAIAATYREQFVVVISGAFCDV
jgi:hypothetical protein